MSDKLEAVDAIWKRACEGREGYCSPDLQAAANWAIAEAFYLAEGAARGAALPAHYQWSEGNREKFDFGRDSAADAILAALRTPTPEQAGEVKRLTGYPDYIDDPDGLERFRQDVLTERGHDMAKVNHNSLGRLIDTIERLRRERDAALQSTPPAQPTADAVERIVGKWLPDFETKSLEARAVSLRAAIEEALGLQPLPLEEEIVGHWHYLAGQPSGAFMPDPVDDASHKHGWRSYPLYRKQFPVLPTVATDYVKLDDDGYLWKWVERGLFDANHTAHTALECIAHHPDAPWKKGRWDVDHKPYAVKFYAAFPSAASPTGGE